MSRLDKSTMNKNKHTLEAMIQSKSIMKAVLLSALSVPFLISPVMAGTYWDGTISRVNLDNNGRQANEDTARYNRPSISADGRYIAFYSSANNLVPGDTNDEEDIFVRDQLTGTIERVSVSSSGIQGNDMSYGHEISADGRYVAFSSFSDNLVPNDTNSAVDVFVHDRMTKKTERVSVASDGTQGFMSSLSFS